MVIQRALLLALMALSTSCYLLTGSQFPEACDDATPSTCEGDQLVICKDQVEFKIQCDAGSCTAGYQECGTCGDSILQELEPCDDGNQSDNDSCLTDCTLAACGDGIVQDGVDECDDGPNNSDINPDACRTDCDLPSCGDNVLDNGEACDDGDLENDDACLDTCQNASCGDGFVQDEVEDCDNGSNNSDVAPNACRTNCLAPSCGDAVIDDGETCDDGPGNSDTEPNACRTTCTLSSCGDNIVDGGESCDDGQNNSDTEPNACRTDCALPSCGDNIVDSGESCDDGPNNSDTAPNACRANCSNARCGDDVIDDFEVCDDGALNSNNTPNACRTNCLLPRCGDGTTDTAEECDNANQNANAPNACRTDCSLPTCGDNITDGNEACDNGAANSDTAPDACRSDCVLARCGDGVIDAVEVCDDGSNNSDTSPNACRTDCFTARCGDGVQDLGEACDDGNPDDTDTCRNACVFASCGDGVIQAGVETCDDGNQDNTDGCNNSCSLTSCGDGAVQGSEQCDDGGANSNTNPNACRLDCRLARCGDGVTDDNETCDDQNFNNQDDCLNTCLLAECGDGFLQAGIEECDDSNAIDGDGCDANCELTCGNGVLNFGAEECDDANINNLDGCDTGCSLTPKLQISVGGSHTCILTQNGEVFCFGEAQSGQLGYANANDLGDDEAIPAIPVSLGGVAVQVVTGAEHSCALLQGGAVKCWGEASSGQLGYGDLNNIGDDETPNNAGAINLGEGAIQLTAGANHTCAILETGAVKCWGENTFGQLGAANTNNIGDNEAVGAAVNVGALVTQIAAGAEHTCVVLANGAAKCWGNGASGRLGYGDQVSIGDTEAPLATTINLGVGRTVKALTAGGAHSCALLDNNELRCWGLNASGELGNGDTQNIGDNEAPNFTSPINLGAGLVATQISAGDKHTCVKLSNNAVKCWGDAGEGRLGYGNLNNLGDNETPATVGAVNVGQPALQVSAGATHTCALLQDNTFRCFGVGLSGQLGTGSVINNVGDNEAPSVAGAVAIGAGVIASRIAVGGSHTCIVTTTNKVLCWGANNFGQLGQANKRTIGDDEAPQTVGFVTVLNAGESIVQMVAGLEHTCVLVNPGGLVRCWGRGLSGRLGYANQNNVGDNETPLSAGNVNVGGVVDQIAAGAEHTCARIGNNIRCWGEGSLGRLGYGNTNDIGDNEAPAAAGNIPFTFNVLAINLSANGRHTCILAAGTNNVRCWGANEFGQLGREDTQNIGDNETAEGTVVVPGLANSDVLAVGFEHTCVILDGTVRCFGRAAEGRLLTGNNNNRLDQVGETASTPIGPTTTELSSGGAHSCAITNNALRCWGRNIFGQLGQGTVDAFGDNETGTPPTTQLGVTPFKVSTGQDHTCAVSSGGAVFCWGFSGQGQLGYSGLQLLIGDDEVPSARPAVAIP